MRTRHRLDASDPPTRPNPQRDSAAPTHATDCRDTPASAATSDTAAPSNTAITALYRCSTTDNATNANPALPPKARKPITTSGVNHVLRLDCQACIETGHARIISAWCQDMLDGL